MTAWEVIPCLLTLRDEFNKVSPRRDKGADGTIGDAAHSPSSDHTPDEDSRVLRDHDADHKNEVHALDIDSTGPWSDGKRGDTAGSWFDKQIHRIIAEEKRRWLDPKDMCRLNYVIWRGYIYDKDDDNFKAVKYNGGDQHFNHAHFSGRYETRAESDTRPWGVYVAPKPPEEDFMSFITNRAQFQAEMTAWAKTPEGAQALLTGLLSSKTGSPVYASRTFGNFVHDVHGERDYEVGDTTGAQQQYSKVNPTSPLAMLFKRVEETNKMVADLAAKLPPSA